MGKTKYDSNLLVVKAVFPLVPQVHLIHEVFEIDMKIIRRIAYNGVIGVCKASFELAI
jgi:hypothetical protein